MTARLAPEVLALLETVSTASLCSQMRGRGFWNVLLHDVHPLRPDLRMAGQALTLRYIPRREDLDPVGVYPPNADTLREYESSRD